ncbi:hypothetical protein ACLOJK_004525 [Asimina triloba]
MHIVSQSSAWRCCRRATLLPTCYCWCRHAIVLPTYWRSCRRRWCSSTEWAVEGVGERSTSTRRVESSVRQQADDMLQWAAAGTTTVGSDRHHRRDERPGSVRAAACRCRRQSRSLGVKSTEEAAILSVMKETTSSLRAAVIDGWLRPHRILDRLDVANKMGGSDCGIFIFT